MGPLVGPHKLLTLTPVLNLLAFAQDASLSLWDPPGTVCLWRSMWIMGLPQYSSKSPSCEITLTRAPYWTAQWPASTPSVCLMRTGEGKYSVPAMTQDSCGSLSRPTECATHLCTPSLRLRVRIRPSVCLLDCMSLRVSLSVSLSLGPSV
jgi:hypothetical protein